MPKAQVRIKCAGTVNGHCFDMLAATAAGSFNSASFETALVVTLAGLGAGFAGLGAGFASTFADCDTSPLSEAARFVICFTGMFSLTRFLVSKNELE